MNVLSHRSAATPQRSAIGHDLRRDRRHKARPEEAHRRNAPRIMLIHQRLIGLDLAKPRRDLRRIWARDMRRVGGEDDCAAQRGAEGEQDGEDAADLPGELDAAGLVALGPEEVEEEGGPEDGGDVDADEDVVGEDADEVVVGDGVAGEPVLNVVLLRGTVIVSLSGLQGWV